MKSRSTRSISVPAAMALALSVLACMAPLRARGETNAPATFGVVTDIQYGDKPSVGPRQYRQSLAKLPECVEAFNSRPLDFVIELGDLMDGYLNDTTRSLSDLDAVLPILRQVKAPLYYVIGNHCMNGGRDTVMTRLHLEKAYYTFTRPAAPGWRFVVLDGTDEGTGVIGQVQKDWLRDILGQAQQNGERVICFCHFPLLQPPGQSHHLKKHEKMVALLREFPCVAGWFSGHDHRGGYVEAAGIHYVNFKGVVEAVSNAYAVVELTTDRIHIQGFGDEPSRDLQLKPRK